MHTQRWQCPSPVRFVGPLWKGSSRPLLTAIVVGLLTYNNMDSEDEYANDDDALRPSTTRWTSTREPGPTLHPQGAASDTILDYDVCFQ